MIVLAFIEDGSIEVFTSRENAATSFEGIDVESGTVQFFEEDGTPLTAEFASSNRRGKLLGSVGWVTSGKYTLVPNREPGNECLALALHEARTLEPNAFFVSIENLKATLLSAGATVDYAATKRRSEA